MVFNRQEFIIERWLTSRQILLDLTVWILHRLGNLFLQAGPECLLLLLLIKHWSNVFLFFDGVEGLLWFNSLFRFFVLIKLLSNCKCWCINLRELDHFWLGVVLLNLLDIIWDNFCLILAKSKRLGHLWLLDYLRLNLWFERCSLLDDFRIIFRLILSKYARFRGWRRNRLFNIRLSYYLIFCFFLSFLLDWFFLLNFYFLFLSRHFLFVIFYNCRLIVLVFNFRFFSNLIALNALLFLNASLINRILLLHSFSRAWVYLWISCIDLWFFHNFSCRSSGIAIKESIVNHLESRCFNVRIHLQINWRHFSLYLRYYFLRRLRNVHSLSSLWIEGFWHQIWTQITADHRVTKLLVVDLELRWWCNLLGRTRLHSWLR